MIKSKSAPAGFPDNSPMPIWSGTGKPEDPNYQPARKLFMRRSFTVEEMPMRAKMFLAGQDTMVVRINGVTLPKDSVTFKDNVYSWNVLNTLRTGKNILIIKAKAANGADRAVYPLLKMDIATKVTLPKPPGFNKPLAAQDVRNDIYQFPFIKNFSPEPEQGASK
jgi:hypothetical protein